MNEQQLGHKQRTDIAYADPELLDAQYLKCKQSGIEYPVVVVADLRDKIGKLFSTHPERAEAVMTEAAAAGKSPCVFLGLPKAAAIALLLESSPKCAKFLRETDTAQFFPIVSIAEGGTQVAFRPIPTAPANPLDDDETR